MVNILVHVHVFYPNMWEEIKEYLKALTNVNLDIWITVPEQNADMKEQILCDFPGGHFLTVDNRGYDIAPFVEVLKRVELAQYHYCIKLHTKRDMPIPAHVGKVDVSGNKWRDLLLAFLKKKNNERILKAFESTPQLGMVGHHALICSKEPNDNQAWSQSLRWIQERFSDSSLISPSFIAGSMFICRAPLMSAFRDILSDTEFERPSREHPSTISHAAERLLGHIITASGHVIRDVFTPPTAKRLLGLKTVFLYSLHLLLRFCYQKKYTKKGYTIIKICKIPVYRSRTS